MSILSAATLGTLLLAAASLSACAVTRNDPPLDSEQRFDLPGAPSIDIRLRLQREHATAASRYNSAALATLRLHTDWMGPLPYRTLTLVDPAWHPVAGASTGDIVLDRSPWWSARGAMAPELATTRGLSRRIWHDALGESALPPALVNGLAEYATRRIVTPMFESINNSPGYAFLEERYFGGFVPYFLRIRLSPDTEGDPLDAYRARPRVAIGPSSSPGTGSSIEAASQTAKAVLALGTLEHWLGRPAFDEIVAALVRAARGRSSARDGADTRRAETVQRVTLDDFEHMASATSGQDLSWFFDQAFRSTGVIDYGIAHGASERQTDGGYVTTVTARRYGDATFTGRSAPRVGPFESGRGVAVRIDFSDGPPATDYWDGRDLEKHFRYRTAAPAVSAQLNPDRIILLDVNRTNNSVSWTPRGPTAATAWAARYMTWVAHLMLEYAALV